MYPATTSLIPVQIALTRFFMEKGWSAFFSQYPSWYLGTTPFRYLTGPVLPAILNLLHMIAYNLSLFEIMLGLIGFCWLLGGLGVYRLIEEFQGDGKWTAVFYLSGPLVPFLFRFSDGRYLITFSFLPLVLWLYLKFLKQPAAKIACLLVISIFCLLLLDTLIIPSVILGLATVFLAQVGWKKAEEKFKTSGWLLLISFLLATVWYTPAYWLTLLGAPSFGGVSAFGVISWLGKLLPTATGLVLAVISVKFFKGKNKLRDFCFYWLFTYIFLTLLRFLSDPDFWLDWSAYNLELQLGLGIAIGILSSRAKWQPLKYLLLGIYLILFGFIFNKFVIGTLQKEVTATVEYHLGQELDRLVKPKEKVFLSGTMVFWLNAFFDIAQVRGGVDQASVNRQWRQAAWEVREGQDPAAAWQALKQLGVNWLVVHTPDSAEYYHDFKFPEKFETSKLFKKVFSDKGDVIYKVEKK